MKLIVGLGNPGEQYQNTRHNVGFQFLDYMYKKLEVSSIKPFRFEKKLQTEIAEMKIRDEQFILTKPQTFMNESGSAVKKVMSNYQLTIDNVFVVHDDLDIPLGEYKIQRGKGPKLHYGVESIANHLHSKDFWRVRIGVDNRSTENRTPGEAYVLQDFVPEEVNRLKKGVFEKILDALIPKY